MANNHHLHEHFCSDFLDVEPGKAGLFDLICLLFSRDVKARSFIDCPEDRRLRTLRRRWLIFVSTVVQKLLLSCKTPMARVGSAVEMWLNLLSSNGGFGSLLLNLLSGRVVRPDRSSATFASMIGSLDTRLDLDKRIQQGDSRYNVGLSIMAAKLSYENDAFVQAVVRDSWKMELLGFYNFWNDYQDQYSTQAIMLHDKNPGSEAIVVAFRGTAPFDADAWCTDFDISWYELENVGKIHRGFMRALGLQKSKGWPKELEESSGRGPFAYYGIREKLKDVLKNNEKAKLILTGHSLGGALAILFVGLLALHEEAWILERLEGVYTYGQPRVGDEQFGEYMKEKMRVHNVKYFRFVYCNDMVPRLPYDDKTVLFKHFGTCLYYNSLYKGKMVGEEPNKNYFSLLWMIPTNLNAVWELIRSFILPYKEGLEYKECIFMRMLRVVGLVVPGLSAHCPQDYVNLTRLGFLPSSPPLQDPNLQQGFKVE